MRNPSLGEALVDFTEWYNLKWVLYAQCSKGRIECSLNGDVQVIQTHNGPEGKYTNKEYEGGSLLDALKTYIKIGGELC